MNVGWGSGERKRAGYRVQIKGTPPRHYGTNRNRPDAEALMAERTLTAHTCAEVHACRATVECAVDQEEEEDSGRKILQEQSTCAKYHGKGIWEPCFSATR